MADALGAVDLPGEINRLSALERDRARVTHRPTEMSVTATERRSQLLNRAMALTRLREGLAALSRVPKVRRKTKPSRKSQERRLDAKRRAGTRKAERRRPYEG